LVLWVALAIVASAAQAATIRVERDGSADFKTIQTALNHSTPGDTILIGPGRYPECQSIYDEDTYVLVETDDLHFIGAGSSDEASCSARPAQPWVGWASY
jgi:hypothetical protein